MKLIRNNPPTDKQHICKQVSRNCDAYRNKALWLPIWFHCGYNWQSASLTVCTNDVGMVLEAFHNSRSTLYHGAEESLH